MIICISKLIAVLPGARYNFWVGCLACLICLLSVLPY